MLDGVLLDAGISAMLAESRRAATSVIAKWICSCWRVYHSGWGVGMPGMMEVPARPPSDPIGPTASFQNEHSGFMTARNSPVWSWSSVGTICTQISAP